MSDGGRKERWEIEYSFFSPGELGPGGAWVCSRDARLGPAPLCNNQDKVSRPLWESESSQNASLDAARDLERWHLFYSKQTLREHSNVASYFLIEYAGYQEVCDMLIVA